MGGNISKDIENFFTKDIKGAFDEIPKAFKQVGDEIRGGLNEIPKAFKQVGDEIKDGFEDTIVKPFKKFGIDVENTFDEVGDVLDASFDYVQETGEFVGSLTINTFDFVVDIGEQLIKIIPLIIEIIKSMITFIEKGLNIAPIVLLLMPALGIIFYTISVINTLDGKDE
jgi:phage-related protein